MGEGESEPPSPAMVKKNKRRTVQKKHRENANAGARGGVVYPLPLRAALPIYTPPPPPPPPSPLLPPSQFFGRSDGTAGEQMVSSPGHIGDV